MKYAIFSALIINIFYQIIAGEECRVDLNVKGEVDIFINTTITSDDVNAQPNTGLVSCPRARDPSEFTACCYDTLLSSNASEYETISGIPRCCIPQDPSSLFYFISDQMALIIAICLTVSLLIITIIIVVCCFWSVCPLYMACRVRYRHDDIIAYASKDDETANLNEMPPEEQKGIKLYSPNAVKITTLKEDA